LARAGLSPAGIIDLARPHTPRYSRYTQYFRKVSEARLVEKFKPIINQATTQTGATAAYKKLTDLSSTPLLSEVLVGSDSLDLDQYVTNKSLDGLFKYIAMEEKTFVAILRQEQLNY
ncbi:MAG: DUF4197 family protein, partial [Methylococcales bacterium]